VPDPDRAPEQYVESLAAIAHDAHCDVLLAGGERSLVLLSRERARFGARLGLPSHDAVERSVDRVVLLDSTARVGLAPPPSRLCTTRSDLERAVEELRLPLVLKPGRSVLPFGAGLRQWPIVVVRTRSSLEDAWRDMSKPCIAQSFEDDAERLSCAGLMTETGLCGFLLVRFIRTWPPGAGAVSFGETIPVPTTLPGRVEALLRDLGWRGIFELELLDLGEDRLAAIDLNPRVFGWLELAVAAGVDLPRLWIDWVSGEVVEPPRVRPGIRYRWEDAEFAQVAWQLRHGNLRAVAGIVRPRRRAVHAHFRLRDPGPLAGRVLDVASRGFRLRRRRLP
jgi:predicted ATP-grasp superfamily ATP-dependent carboligase